MSGTLTPTNVVTTEQASFIDNLLTQAFEAVVNFLTSVVTILVNFFTQPAVLGALVTIGIVYGAWRMLKRKGVSM